MSHDTLRQGQLTVLKENLVNKILIVLLAAVSMLLVVSVFALIAAFPTMFLWNWLMPELFGIKAVTFWQALGINLLTGILFKNEGRLRPPPADGHSVQERGASASSSSNGNRR